jgi:hypothetical protein
MYLGGEILSEGHFGGNVNDIETIIMIKKISKK